MATNSVPQSGDNLAVETLTTDMTQGPKDQGTVVLAGTTRRLVYLKETANNFLWTVEFLVGREPRGKKIFDAST